MSELWCFYCNIDKVWKVFPNPSGKLAFEIGIMFSVVVCFGPKNFPIGPARGFPFLDILGGLSRSIPERCVQPHLSLSSPRGGDSFTSLCQMLQSPDLLFEASKAPFLTSKIATSSGAPRQAPLELAQRQSKKTTNSSNQV